MERSYPFDIIEKLLQVPSIKEGSCKLLIVHYKDKQGLIYTKDHGVFTNKDILNKKISEIRENMSRNTNYEIDTNQTADHFLYDLKQQLDYEDSVINYEIKEYTLYE